MIQIKGANVRELREMLSEFSDTDMVVVRIETYGRGEFKKVEENYQIIDVKAAVKGPRVLLIAERAL